MARRKTEHSQVQLLLAQLKKHGIEVDFENPDSDLRIKSVALSRQSLQDAQALAERHLEDARNHFSNLRDHTQKLFYLVLIMLGFDLILFVLAIAFAVWQKQELMIVFGVGVIAAALVAGVLVFVHHHAQARTDMSFERVDRIQRFLLANSICDNLGETQQNQVRAQLANLIADTEMEKLLRSWN
ncbi:MAG: hypothetical protein JXA42_01340 [Anaerolineales bacterium]|nr:hypothetical protein [Anaerolineales bacterium]